METHETISLVFSSISLAVSLANMLHVRRNAKAAERSADAAARAVEHQIERETPKGAVCRPPDSIGVPPVLVANTGAVAFTVREVGLGRVPFEYPFGTPGDHGAIRTVPSGGSAIFAVPGGFSGRGLAYAVLADGTVLQEDAPCR